MDGPVVFGGGSVGWIGSPVEIGLRQKDNITAYLVVLMKAVFVFEIVVL